MCVCERKKDEDVAKLTIVFCQISISAKRTSSFCEFDFIKRENQGIISVQKKHDLVDTVNTPKLYLVSLVKKSELQYTLK